MQTTLKITTETVIFTSQTRNSHHEQHTKCPKTTRITLDTQWKMRVTHEERQGACQRHATHATENSNNTHTHKQKLTTHSAYTHTQKAMDSTSPLNDYETAKDA
jgi:hypothetical protein